ncbi:hypothetical protein QOT17_015488 [Balamuthia mandrillaris]
MFRGKRWKEEKPSVLYDLPDEVWFNVFVLLNENDALNLSLANKRFHALGNDEVHWKRRIRQELCHGEWKGYLSPQYVEQQSLRPDRWQSKKALFFHLRNVGLRLRHKELLQAWDLHKQIFEGNAVMLVHYEGSTVVDVEFATKRHLLGLYLGYLLPVVGALRYGLRAGFLLCFVGALLRYCTYSVYYDHRQRLRKRQEWSAARRCFLWGCLLCMMARWMPFFLKWQAHKHGSLHRIKRKKAALQQQQQQWRSRTYQESPLVLGIQRVMKELEQFLPRGW